ncbi:putative Ig domain-containing protein [Salmonirosea aquatica]|uniref:T9SS type A sorting domain-containing protein n=1 Tax=Salmonirosea aquatica TaxID=2654236 RepID=A0A7C9BC90_9BACT|nr:T9SS type A sorting domain-containing protein [Cytophagaceae bacterium SJW1-29]
MCTSFYRPIRLRQIFLAVSLLGIFISGSFRQVLAQHPGTQADKQRYFSLMLLNISQEKDFELDVIRQAAAAGMNSVLLTVHWDRVYKDSPTGPGDWYRYDSEIKLATELGLKVAIRIMVGRNNAFLKGFWTDAESMKDYRQYPLREGYQSTSFSYLHQPSVNLAADFVKQVTERYKYLQTQNNLLFISTVATPTQEAGYHMFSIPPNGEYKDLYLTIFDYSTLYKQGFVTWLRGKYKKLVRLNLLWGSDYKTFDEILPPVTPWDVKESFFGRRGKDWYIYRHLAFKQFNDRMIQAVREVDNSISYVAEFGAVIDNISAVRATLAFRDLCEKADGIKIHDSEQYDHRWTMDVIRSNSRPDQMVMNEVFYADYLPHSEFYEQIDECFESGAKMVVFVLSTTGHVAAVREVIRNSAAKWLNKPLEPIVATDTVSYLLSRVIDKTVNDVGAFDTWKRLARGGSTPRPVYVHLEEDILTDEYWKAAANMPPYILNPIPMQIIAVNRAFTFRLPTDTFADRDGSIMRVEVPSLPSWLRYENGVLTGTPTVLGDSRLLVRGIDDEGAVTEAYLTIRVDTRENANKPPTVRKNLANVVTAVNESFLFTLPGDLFVDDDGTVSRIEASELPPWLTFQNGQFKGFPTKAADYRVALKAYDDLNAFVEIYFTIQVVEPRFLNNAPYVQNTIPVKFTKVNEPFKYTLPTNIFGDGDGYIALITAQNLPTWLTFSLNEFSGIPPQVGEYRIIVRAYDNVGGYVDTPFILNVEIPRLTFDLLRSGRAIDRQLIRTLKEADTLRAGSMPPLLNIYAYGNFEFDRVDFSLSGPYRHNATSRKFPHALFDDESGFAPYIGSYTLLAKAYKMDSLVLINSLRFSIAPGDSIQTATSLDEWQSYPNPFENVFNIQLPESQPSAAYSFSLVNTSGQRISVPAKWVSFYNSIAQIDLSGLSIGAGIYFVRVESNGEYVRLFRVMKK